jgi:hypothetical protein
MVYVSIDDWRAEVCGECGYRKLFIDMTVVGFLPQARREVAEFFTKLFAGLCFKTRSYTGLLGLLGYFFDELGREKIYLTTIPVDTHLMHVAEGAETVDVFVDVGSPFRHFIYVAEDGPRYSLRPGVRAYRMVGSNEYETFDVRADFFEDAEIFLLECRASWCTPEFLDKVGALASDKEMHVVTYPHPVNEEHKRLLRIMEKALELANKGKFLRAKEEEKTKGCE